MLSVVMLSNFTLSVVIPSAIIPSVAKLTFVSLSVI
jgi:hypothetical protein